MSTTLTASDLYAISQGAGNTGEYLCHWCGSKCTSHFIHDNAPRVIGVKPSRPCKRPNDPYICQGCWLFRRGRITVPFLAGGYRDGQCPGKHSWWITEKGAWAISKNDHEELYECLLDPPTTFALTLLDGIDENHLQLSHTNCYDKLNGTTPLNFTINNIHHEYNVYELMEGLINGPEGKEPGVGALIRLLGPYEVNAQEEKKGRGRPPVREDRKPNRTVRKG